MEAKGRKGSKGKAKILLPLRARRESAIRFLPPMRRQQVRVDEADPALAPPAQIDRVRQKVEFFRVDD
jgi:hypothetical protein